MLLAKQIWSKFVLVEKCWSENVLVNSFSGQQIVSGQKIVLVDYLFGQTKMSGRKSSWWEKRLPFLCWSTFVQSLLTKQIV